MFHGASESVPSGNERRKSRRKSCETQEKRRKNRIFGAKNEKTGRLTRLVRVKPRAVRGERDSTIPRRNLRGGRQTKRPRCAAEGVFALCLRTGLPSETAQNVPLVAGFCGAVRSGRVGITL